jgi:hypothetical protein
VTILRFAKRAVGVCAATTLLSGMALCEEPNENRLFFPHNSVRGYVEFQVAPPHNEVDLGLCFSPDQCSGYARYVWNGYVEVQPLGRTVFRRIFLFTEPKVFGGNNVPQKSYTASGAPILLERIMGAGVDLGKGFQLRVTHHRTQLLGRFNVPPEQRNWRVDGPYGLNTTVGVRWSFGGWGRY